MSISLFKTKKVALEHENRQWNNQEIADFYRAADILKRAGLDVEIDSGMTDEGEPWFVFVRSSGDGEVSGTFCSNRWSVCCGELIKSRSLQRFRHSTNSGPNVRQVPFSCPKKQKFRSTLLAPDCGCYSISLPQLLLNVDGVKLTMLKKFWLLFPQKVQRL